MIVKRYSGRSAEEALAQAKWELGDDAVILSSGKSRDRWWKIWETGFQVLVATDYPSQKSDRPTTPPAERVVPMVRPTPHPETEPEIADPVLDRIEIRPPKAVAPETTAEPTSSPPVARSERDQGGEAEALMQALDRINDRLGRLEGFPGTSGQRAFQLLSDRGMELNVARELALGVSGAKAKTWQAELAAAVKGRMPPAVGLANDSKLVVVVVGPTGSGKTTTIAKLAAHYHLEQQKSVLMVTTDTFRVGAVEQLETFAGILKVPFRVAHRPKDVSDVIHQSEADVVLVDTQGHSVRHSLHMAEVRSIWEGSRATEVLLTVPATLAAEEVRSLVAGFLQGQAGKLVITKVDEAHNPGPLISALLDSGSPPLSFITNGQSVPEDIRSANVDQLVTWLMEGEYRD